MTRKLAFVMIASLIVAGMALANAGPAPLPKGRKVIEPPVRFEEIEKHADYVFYLYYGAVYFEYKLVEVKDSKPITLNFKTKDRSPSPYLELLAIERTDFEMRKKADPSLKWLTDKKDGVLLTRPTPPAATAPLDAKEIPVTTYRVTLKDGKLKAEKVEPQKTGAAEQSGSLPLWGFGVVMSLSMTWLGLWFARRTSTRNGNESNAPSMDR